MSLWHILFAWPNGITTGNLIASLIWVLIAGLVVWFFRDFIGKKMGAFLHRHHREHLEWLEKRSATSSSDSGSPSDSQSSDFSSES